MKFSDLFKDERGVFSSKRVIGIICGLQFCLLPFFSFIDFPPQYYIDALVVITIGCLGLSSIDKFSKKN